MEFHQILAHQNTSLYINNMSACWVPRGGEESVVVNSSLSLVMNSSETVVQTVAQIRPS